MAAIISSSTSLSSTSKFIFPNLTTNLTKNTAFSRIRPRCFSDNPHRKNRLFPLKECAISIALAAGLLTGAPNMGWSNNANAANLAFPDLAVLISGPPIKDPGALLRYALPIDNKAIREVQKPLEDITDSLKISGVKALDSVERNLVAGYSNIGTAPASGTRSVLRTPGMRTQQTGTRTGVGKGLWVN